jgi:hypothetical protein
VFLTPVVVTVLQAANEAKKAIVTRRATWVGILIYSKEYVFYQKIFRAKLKRCNVTGKWLSIDRSCKKHLFFVLPRIKPLLLL